MHTTAAKKETQMLKKLLLLGGLLICQSGAQADASQWRGYVALGVSSGGDTLAKTQVSDRQTGETQAINLRAGSVLGSLALGAEFRFTELVALRASGSYGRQGTTQFEKGTFNVDTQRYEGGHSYDGGLTFTTLASEVACFFSVTPALRIGLGARQSVGELSGTGTLASLTNTGSFSAAPGSVVELQYLFGTSQRHLAQDEPAWGVHLRAVQESFTHNGTVFNADHVGIGLMGYF